MLSPKAQLNLKQAQRYFREHLAVGDYYGQNQQAAGEWFGLGVEKLGLGIIVTEREFLRLCEGSHPKTGARLTLRHNSSRQENGQRVANRRVFYDFTFSPPKSVSVVALLRDSRIVAVHEQAVRTAMRELERYAETRVRKGRQDAERLTGNLVGAAFRHDTSRELDPHLHTHCVVLNATFDPVERRWKALQAGGMYRAQKLAEAVYYHQLSNGLVALGYAVERNTRDFEIKGVPASVVACFSKRRQQIDAEMERLRARGKLRGKVPDARERIARDSRQRKRSESTAMRLRAQWERELSPAEGAALDRLRGRSASPQPADAAALLAWADEHVFERRAVAEEAELLAAALRRGAGTAIDVTVLRTALEQRDYVRDARHTVLTARDVLRSELELVFAAQDGRGRHAALAPEHVSAARLSAEQRRAVAQILGSRDFITLFRGGAGTGKSFTLEEVQRGLRGAGHVVLVCAPQRQQVEDLARDGLPAQTVARLLAAATLPDRAIVLVDEAGQIGGRQMRDLVRLVEAHRGRLILSGDTRQHGAVAASDALRAIEAFGRLKPAEIQTIRRQDPARGETFSARMTIARYRAAVKAAAAGDIVGSFDRLDRLGCIRELEERSRRDVLAAEYLAARARQESALVVAQTWSEVRVVNEAIRTRLRAAGQLGPGHIVTTLQVIDGTVAERRDPTFYQPGQYACFVQRYNRFAKGEACEILAATERGVVLRKNGRRSTMSLRYAERFVVARELPLEIAPGDRLQLKFNGRSAEALPLNNGELVTVKSLAPDGGVVVEDASGRTKTLTPTQRLLSRGYAVTAYASQGKTVDTVLFADAGSRAASNDRQWYVTISRGRKRVLVFTPDKAALRLAAQRAGVRRLALEISPPAQRPAPRPGLAWVQGARAVVANLQRLACLGRTREAASLRAAPSGSRPPGVRPHP